MNRGYSMVGLVNPKNKLNVGSVMRAAHAFDAAQVVVSGRRISLHAPPTDTSKAARHIPLLRADSVLDAVPHDCVPVAVELLTNARNIYGYTHPERAFYIFGAEDATLGKAITDKCRDIVFIPSTICLNLAAAVNVVLYDRALKRNGT